MGSCAGTDETVGTAICCVSPPCAYCVLAVSPENGCALRPDTNGREQSQLRHRCLQSFLSSLVFKKALGRGTNCRNPRPLAVAGSLASCVSGRANIQGG